MSSNTQAKDKS